MLHGLASAWLETERARGLAPTTIGVRASHLRRFLCWLEGRDVTEAPGISGDIIETFLLEESFRPTRLKGGKPPSKRTLVHELSTIRGFLGHLVKRRLLLGNPADGIGLGRIPRTFRRPPSRGAILLLLGAPGSDPIGLRDRAIFETLYSTAIRRGEMCALDLADLDRSAGTLLVRMGKGGKDRLVPVGETALKALWSYLQRGRPKLRPRGAALFVGEWGSRLKPHTVNYLCKEWCRRAEIEPPITPHLLRHACATHLLESGADVRHVQALLGHAWIGTTQIYTHVSMKGLREDMERHDPRASLDGESGS